jgi:hypothetical protein
LGLVIDGTATDDATPALSGDLNADYVNISSLLIGYQVDAGNTANYVGGATIIDAGGDVAGYLSDESADTLLRIERGAGADAFG